MRYCFYPSTTSAYGIELDFFNCIFILSVIEPSNSNATTATTTTATTTTSTKAASD